MRLNFFFFFYPPQPLASVDNKNLGLDISRQERERAPDLCHHCLHQLVNGFILKLATFPAKFYLAYG